MDIKIVGTTGEEVKQEPMKESDSLPVITGDLMVQSVGQMFDMRPAEILTWKEKIGLLIDYAKTQTDDRTPEGIKWAIRSLQGRGGTPPLGEKWGNYLSKYAWLKLDEIRLKKEGEKYGRNKLF